MAESSLTLKFKGMEAEVLDNMVNSGVFNTKSEAIRAALVHYSLELGFFDKKKLWANILKHSPRKVTPEKLTKEIEAIKNEI